MKHLKFESAVGTSSVDTYKLISRIQQNTMPTRRRQQFIHGQAAWMLAVIVVLAALGALSLELFFVLSLIGLLVVIELTAPFNLTPTWRSRLKWLILAGLIGFMFVVVRRILEILPQGLI